jgi:hypothetical protein
MPTERLRRAIAALDEPPSIQQTHDLAAAASALLAAAQAAIRCALGMRHNKKPAPTTVEQMLALLTGTAPSEDPHQYPST